MINCCYVAGIEIGGLSKSSILDFYWAEFWAGGCWTWSLQGARVGVYHVGHILPMGETFKQQKLLGPIGLRLRNHETGHFKK